MTVTDQFFSWYYNGLGGLGGWFIFAALALGAIMGLIYYSQSRQLPVLSWLMGACLVAIFVVPTIIFRFVGRDTQITLEQFLELFFYLGVIGGVIPGVIALAYFVSYRGLIACPKRHIYDASLPSCPVCNAKVLVPPPLPPVPPAPPVEEDVTVVPPRLRKARQKSSAMLVDSVHHHRYELYVGNTTVGRKEDNDIVIKNSTVSKEHFVIQESNGHFTIFDRASRTGTFVNGQRLRHPIKLESGDELLIGDITLKFIVL